jgi:MarR family 2-MHQ and catechol resistance regulon transcriptional repressor
MLEQPAGRTWESFVRAKAAVRRVVHRELRERGLTGAQLQILRVLAEAGGAGVKLNEISQCLHVTCGNITGLVDRLEEAGWLTRVPHAEDRRITLAALTPAGRELFEQIYPSHRARIEHLMSALSEREQTQLAKLLERLADRAIEMERE